jgi:hypothetical protein
MPHFSMSNSQNNTTECKLVGWIRHCVPYFLDRKGTVTNVQRTGRLRRGNISVQRKIATTAVVTKFIFRFQKDGDN